ncbi:hypothetical protein COEREDRAFT_46282 [Coemansia reversa NRRL 1564]|uniref:GATOR2 complex protein MIO zinc-ribbon like domain-containing protein n=1 Tax=Coemansia reversa (strain ATCC 12441 / NRRL 1564) TaxID=763665 RepID=A0A2G5B7G3_COERN|nr:hypothetical protein COEREDRAFT_46282 [Coemansia reversa NRRL 1564]|eukprot:PIA14667.1 hypothetical protein COEREDRAFT_46282 [Coemansia reversa NRRL 1564]
MNYRVAAALRYLDDSSLTRYLLWAGRLAVRRGDLDGLLITGVCGSGRLIMQTYVDNTADVQTAALASIFDPCSDAAADETAEKWIYAYRHMLNKWRMFTTRCLFDIAHGNYRQSKGLLRVSEVAKKIAIPPADIRCMFCHQSLDHDPSHRKNRQMRGAVRGDSSGMSTPPQTRLLYTHCPKCNGKLPRCVVCRMKLGTPVVASDGDVSEVLVGDFSQWFSWCQTCGHGGHVSHMQSWFATHSECPVPACECECEQKH